jgi:hypothetical protein
MTATWYEEFYVEAAAYRLLNTGQDLACVPCIRQAGTESECLPPLLVAQEMLWSVRQKLGAHMVGVLVLAIAGVVAWKYRDSLSEYVKGNTGPAREKVDELLRTAQQRSETLLDQAKEQISSRLESARGKINAGASETNRERPTE